MSIPSERDRAILDAQEAVADWARHKLEAQPWWKQKSNTVTTAVSGAITYAWWLIGSATELPQSAVIGIGALLFVGQIVGVNGTKNGFTRAEATRVQAAVAANGLTVPVQSSPPLPGDRDA